MPLFCSVSQCELSLKLSQNHLSLWINNCDSQEEDANTGAISYIQYAVFIMFLYLSLGINSVIYYIRDIDQPRNHSLKRST